MFKVLIVDDCYSDVYGLTNFVPWSDLNCEVVATASNGEDGYNKAINLKPDIIITDISMPITNGIEMTERIKLILDNVYYIYITCYSSFEYAQSAIKNNVCAYILKPIKIPDLLDAIKTVTAQITISKTSSKLQSELYKQLVNSKEILLEKYITDLLLGFEHTDSISDFFEINNTCEYKICLLNIEDELDSDINEIYMLRIYLKKLVSEKFPNSYKSDFEQKQIVLLMPETDVLMVETRLDSVQKDFHSNFSKSFSAYLSQETYTLDSVSEPFKNILNLINSNYFVHKSQIVVLDNMLLNSQRLSENFDYSALYSDIFNVLNSKMDIDIFVSKHFENIVINSVYLRSFCYHVICILNVYLLEQNKSLSDVFEDETIIWHKLAKFSTIVDVRQWIINIISTVKQFMNDTKNSNNDKTVQMVNEIKNYIDDNFQIDTALEDSANQQDISLNYANIIFKKHENQTIFEYLVKKRLNEAKKLLRNTNMTISEIAANVGYKSNTYFSTAFKKAVGRTPQSYRDDVTEDDIDEKGNQK